MHARPRCRRQSNRESARRTRAKRNEEISALREENDALRAASAKVGKRCDELAAANGMLVAALAPMGEQQRCACAPVLAQLDACDCLVEASVAWVSRGADEARCCLPRALSSSYG